MPVFIKKIEELNLRTTKREPPPLSGSKQPSMQGPPPESRSKSPSLMSIFNVDVVFGHFLSHLDIARILPLKRVNKRINELVTRELKVRWNINEKLKRFVMRPEEFRTVLGRYGALICGSFVLQFFDGVVWDESDLDINAQYGVDADGMGRYLIKEEGYKVQLSEQNPDEDQYTRVEDILKVTTYVRSWTKGSKTGESKIQVVSTRSLPIRAIIGGAYTTAVTNIISWNKAYSVFADATFEGRETFMLYPLNDRHKAGILKYAHRGWSHWTTRTSRRPLANRTPRSLSSGIHGGHRRLADSNTWVVKFDTTGVGRPSTPDSVLEHACFTVTHANLKYKYREYEGADRSFQPGPNFQIVL